MNKKIDSWINKADLIGQVSDLIINSHYIDAKGLINGLYDLVIKDIYVNSTIYKEYPSLFEAFELEVKLVIEYIFDKYGWNTSLLTHLTPESAGVVSKEFLKGLSEKLGQITGVYSALINTAKLSNALAGIINVNEVQEKQARALMISSFIRDYVLKYNSDIDRMYRDVSEGYNVDPADVGFWSVWAMYQYKNNNNIASIFTRTSLYDVAIEANVFFRNYDVNFPTQINMYERLTNPNSDGRVYNKELDCYQADNNFNKKYFILHNAYQDATAFNIKHGTYSMGNLKVSSTCDNSIDFAEYSKVIDGTQDTVIVKYVRKFSIEIIFHNTVNGSNVETQTINLQPFYVPSFFYDVPKDYWAIPSIAELFNKGVIKGYDDGTFRPKPVIKDGIEVGYVSVGEFLAMTTRAIFGDYYITDYLGYKDINGIVFSKYVEFLKNELNLDLGFSSYSQSTLDQRAKRAYTAKVLTSIVRYQDGLKKLDYKQLDGDWDSYSDFLNQECIVKGKDDLPNPGYQKFDPDAYIPRDETAVMIANSMKVVQGEKLTCEPRKKYKQGM